MIAELGHFTLILALSVALIQAIFPLLGAQTGNNVWISLAQPAAVFQFLLVAISFGCLMQLYITSDFSVINVAKNSNITIPMIYKVSGVWGNHEGSLLLWVLILSIFGGAVAYFGKNLPPDNRAHSTWRDWASARCPG